MFERGARPRGEGLRGPAPHLRAPEAPLGVQGTPGTFRPGPHSRRGFLQAVGATAVSVAGTPASAAVPSLRPRDCGSSAVIDR
ncbi:twin-arginine translocation signal domain-containing protein [Streptomyces shaanxiensis]